MKSNGGHRSILQRPIIYQQVGRNKDGDVTARKVLCWPSGYQRTGRDIVINRMKNFRSVSTGGATGIGDAGGTIGVSKKINGHGHK